MHQLHKKAVRLHKGRATETSILSTKSIGNTGSATSVGIKETLHHTEKPSWTATERIRIRITTVVWSNRYIGKVPQIHLLEIERQDK